MDAPENNASQQVDLEHISPKQLNDIERHVQELLAVMRKAKLTHEPLQEALRLLEQKLGETRRKRFDESNPEYRGF